MFDGARRDSSPESIPLFCMLCEYLPLTTKSEKVVRTSDKLRDSLGHVIQCWLLLNKNIWRESKDTWVALGKALVRVVIKIWGYFLGMYPSRIHGRPR